MLLKIEKIMALLPVLFIWCSFSYEILFRLIGSSFFRSDYFILTFSIYPFFMLHKAELFTRNILSFSLNNVRV